MTAPAPDRPTTTDPVADGIERAYRDASALAEDGRAPARSVRANVLAAAREIASQAAPALDATPITPAGRGRAIAANVSSWRVRAGVAGGVAILAGLLAWRFDGRASPEPRDAIVASADSSPARSAPLVAPAPDVAPSASVAAAPPPVQVAIADAPLAVAPRMRARAKQAAASSADVVSLSQRIVVAEADSPIAAAPAPMAEPRAMSPPPAPSLATAVPDETAVADAGTTSSRALPRAAPASPARAMAGAAVTNVQRLVAVNSPVRRMAQAASGSNDVAAAEMAPIPDSRPPLPALQRAADAGDVAQITTLLAARGAAVDAPDADGRTALLHAVLAQHADAVRALLAAGAEPARADAGGLTPRAAARRGASAEIAGLFDAR